MNKLGINNKLLVGGDWIDNLPAKLVVINPANLKIVGYVPSLTAEQVDYAIDCAHSALPAWSAAGAVKRREIMLRFGRMLEERKHEIASTITMESGKPIKEALEEVNYANELLFWYAECIMHIHGHLLPSQYSNGRWSVEYKPIGVSAIIIPWHFPAAMIMRKLAPALAAGCTVVLKPDPRTPLTANTLSQIASEAGLPAGVINVVMGESRMVGKVFAANPKVRLLAFTGSNKVGKLLMRECSATMKKMTTEMTGNTPFIVSRSANVEQVAKGITAAKFCSDGRSYVAPDQFFVHKKLINPLLEALKTRLSALNIGDGMDERTDLGPLIDGDAIDRYNSFLNAAHNAGASIIKINAQQQSSFNAGYFVSPVIVLYKRGSQLLYYDGELTGPVIMIQPFEDLQEVIDLVNSNEQALAAYFYTQDYQEMLEVPGKLEYGMVAVNDCRFSDLGLPFSGCKQSGNGKNGGIWGIKEFLETRCININTGS